MKEGKTSCMNQERVAMLNQIGFAWSTTITGKPNKSKKSQPDGASKEKSPEKSPEKSKTTNKKNQASEGLSSLSAAADVIASMRVDSGNINDGGETDLP
jgi:uncharacterized Zn finger protein (UPF0148 family)